MLPDAIYLHSSWRAGSTYVWNKFRQRADTYCYFEPLNEHLADLTTNTIDRFVPWAYANHPKLASPYLEEYRPLLSNVRGITRFPSHLCFGCYCATPGASLPELEDYLTHLTRFAAGLRRRPVLGFVRTDLRVSWFRTKMPGAHIFIRRDPRRQFMSMLLQAVKGNPYFLQRGAVILRHNLQELAFAPLLATIKLSELLEVFSRPDLFQRRLRNEGFLRQVYSVVYFMWMLSRELGEPYCHLVIDIDRLSWDEIYHRKIEKDLAELTGIRLSFADCQVQRYEANLSAHGLRFATLEREIEAFSRSFLIATPQAV